MLHMDSISQTQTTQKKNVKLSIAVFDEGSSKKILARCEKCNTRELKTLRKKQSNQGVPINELSESKKIFQVHHDSNIVVYNGEFVLPCRFCCYSSHHCKKKNDPFTVEILATDSLGNCSKTITKILVKDDHKAASKKPKKRTASKIEEDNPDGVDGNHAKLMKSEVKEVQKPTILKLLPNQGPQLGGTEVSLLGFGFTKDTKIVFGNKIANTTYWTEFSLIAIVPPGDTEGGVKVSILGCKCQSQFFFVYKNQMDFGLEMYDNSNPNQFPIDPQCPIHGHNIVMNQ